MVKVIVFGATGFLGSEIAKALARKGHETSAALRDANPSNAVKAARVAELKAAGATVVQRDGGSNGLVDLLKGYTHVVNAMGEDCLLQPDLPPVIFSSLLGSAPSASWRTPME